MKRRAFTMMELLVVVVIIAILAAMVLGALQMARQAAREAATKATIAKLNNIIMQRYESYLTRRVPINTAGMTPVQARQARLWAIRDLIRLEMPDRNSDVYTDPVALPARPPLSQLYLAKYNATPPDATGTYSYAEWLYQIVSLGNPEAMEQFNQSEISDADGDGWPEFCDGWKRPIMFLRWAPGYSPYSGIQVADATNNHDPLDPQKLDGFAYHLIPLIYSGGSSSDPGLDPEGGYVFKKDMFTDSNFMKIGTPNSSAASGIITNHNIEQR